MPRLHAIGSAPTPPLHDYHYAPVPPAASPATFTIPLANFNPAKGTVKLICEHGGGVGVNGYVFYAEGLTPPEGRVLIDYWQDYFRMSVFDNTGAAVVALSAPIGSFDGGRHVVEFTWDNVDPVGHNGTAYYHVEIRQDGEVLASGALAPWTAATLAQINFVRLFAYDAGNSNNIRADVELLQVFRHARRPVYYRSPDFVGFPDYDYLEIDGQSLSVGCDSDPALSVVGSATDKMFNSGVVNYRSGPLDVANYASLTALLESHTPGGFPGPVETMSSALAAAIAALAPGHKAIVAGHGFSNVAYAGLKKGSATSPTYYTNGLAQYRGFLRLCEAGGLSYRTRTKFIVHGETDHVDGTANYAACLQAWRFNQDDDVRRLTHQASPLWMFQTQISQWTIFGATTSLIPYAQLAASDADPYIVTVGPKYHLPYDAGGIHLTNASQRHMGEDYAKAYKRTLLDGVPWVPLRPIAASITRAGAVIDVPFSVPVAPIVIDDVNVTDPGDYGFEFYDDGGPSVTIASVVLLNPTTVRVTLSGPPTGAGKRIRYAYTGGAGAGGGPTTGPRGCLRDSDATASLYGFDLWNWACHFDEACP